MSINYAHYKHLAELFHYPTKELVFKAKKYLN